MKSLEYKRALASAIDAARAAGGLMRQNLNAPKTVAAATSHDIKLELDVRCQRLIAKKLHAIFPRIALLGEEGTSGADDAEFRWVVDPIDGTVNFFHGIPHASVSIALQQRGDKWQVAGGKKSARHTAVPVTCPPTHVTLLGVVYDPFTDELWTAVRGGSARLNGRVIRVSRCRKLNEAVVSIGFAKSRASLEAALPYFLWLARRVRKMRMLGSAALALTYVASGRLDAYIERGISLWDVAAGGLILECAGGTFWSEPAGHGHKFRMIASNGLLHGKLPKPK